MDLKIFSTKKEFNIKSLKPDRFNVLKFWLLALLSLFIILVVGMVLSFQIFIMVYKKDYKLKTEEVSVDKINIEELKSVVNMRQQFIDQESIIPKDPSM